MWLDSNGKQLVHWPIKEIEMLRGNKVELEKVELKQGEFVEVKGTTAAQVSHLTDKSKSTGKRLTYIC